MIPYGTWQFACPPGVGEEWFLRAAQLAGHGPGFAHQAHVRWDVDDPDRYRVSLVCNPFAWLPRLFHCPPATNHAGRVSSLPRGDTFQRFADAYLRMCPGELTRLALAYSADSVLRIEDCPDAAVELLRSLGSDGRLLEGPWFRLPAAEGWDRFRAAWGGDARMVEFRRAERELFDRYDYW